MNHLLWSGTIVYRTVGKSQQNSEHLISHKEGVKAIADVDFKAHSKQLVIKQLIYIHIFYLPYFLKHPEYKFQYQQQIQSFN